MREIIRYGVGFVLLAVGSAITAAMFGVPTVWIALGLLVLGVFALLTLVRVLPRPGSAPGAAGPPAARPTVTPGTPTPAQPYVSPARKAAEQPVAQPRPVPQPSAAELPALEPSRQEPPARPDPPRGWDGG